MTAPDPTILVAAIKLAEEGLQTFRGIDDPEIKREVELNEAILAAAKAYQPMREALEKAERSLVTACRAGLADGDFDEQEIADMVNANPTIIAVRAALNPAGPA
ncbi:hypothetical protein [Reyranella sp.]|uniref:hypothetical protein n=1 Tax=Reyranella sp. TaxID=1929291 RepID=UPI004036E434